MRQRLELREQIPCGDEVFFDLGFQGVEGVELCFVAEFADKGEGKGLAIEIAFEIKEVSFDVQGWLCIRYRRAQADVHGGAMGRFAHLRMRGVHAVGWQTKSVYFKVGSGIAKLASTLVALDDFAGEGVFAAEHLACSIKLAGLDSLADAGAADSFVIKRNTGKTVDDEIHFLTEALEQFHVTLTLMAEGEVCAHANGLDAAEVHVQSLDEHLGGDLAHGFIEGKHEGGLDAERFNGGEALREMLDESGGVFGREHGGGMLRKGDA